MAAQKHPRIVSIKEAEAGEPMTREHGEKYASRHYQVSRLIESAKLGYHLTVIPPGRRAFPYHFHHVNEELFFVLSGSGVLRDPAGETPIGEGDLICCPAGPEGAHQLINTGAVDLRYLALSTLHDPEVVEYPDAGKYGVIAGRPPGGRPQDAKFAVFAYRSGGVDYWDGE